MAAQAYPKYTKITMPFLNEQEKAEIREAGLLKLHKVMQKPVDESIAEEALQNYEADKQQTVIKGTTVKADKASLHAHLGLTDETKGQNWTPDMVAELLEESQEERAARKKGAQGIPTEGLKEHSKLMKIVASAICLKKNDKHIAETQFMEAAKLFEAGGKCDFARMLEKHMNGQMMAITGKGQKLYTCAPIWQELYNKVKQNPEASKRPRPAASSEETPQQAKKLKEKSTSSGTVGSGGSQVKPLEAVKSIRGSFKQTDDRQKTLKNLLANTLSKSLQKKQGGEASERNEKKAEEKTTGPSSSRVGTSDQGKEERGSQLMSTWETCLHRVEGQPSVLKIKLPEEPVGLPYDRMQVLDLKAKEEDQKKEIEGRLRATMIALNTIALQTQALYQQTTKETPVVTEKLEEERAEWNQQKAVLEGKIQQLEEEKRKENQEKKAARLKIQQLEEEKIKENQEKEAARLKKNKAHKRLKKQVSKERKKSKAAASELVKLKNLFNAAILQKIIKSMTSTSEEGVWLDGGTLAAFTEQTTQIISDHTEKLLEELASSEQDKEAEETDPEEEEEEKDDQDQDSDQGKDESDQDKSEPSLPGHEDSEQSDQEKGKQEEKEAEDQGQTKGGGESEEDQNQQGQEDEEAKKKMADEEEARKKAVHQDQMERWYRYKPEIASLVNRLTKKYNQWKKVKHHAQMTILKEATTPIKEKEESLRLLIKSFLDDWPAKNPHDLTRCSLPPHPSCIQVLETPPELGPEDNRVLKDRWIYPGLKSMAIPIELLLGDRPKYQCMDECRKAIKANQVYLREQKSILEQALNEIKVPEESPSEKDWEDCLIQTMFWLRAWLSLNQQEVHFLEACLEKLPDNPTLLYALAPPEEALPAFYPVLFPQMTEPADINTYKEIVTQLQEWKKQMVEKLESVKQLAQAGEHLNEQTFCEIFTVWDRHQTALIEICNRMLQTHIIAQKLPSEKQQKLHMDIEIQWLADSLLEARIEINAKVFDSWLATAHWCVQTAKARLATSPAEAYFQDEHNMVKKQRLSIFEVLRPPEVCKARKMSKATMDLMEDEVRQQGEPYDTGQHPEIAARLKRLCEDLERSQKQFQLHMQSKETK